MPFNISEKYLRQYGLVHQDRLSSLNILIKGDNEALPFLLINLAFCGAGSLQGGVYLDKVPELVQDYHIRNSFLFKKQDLGRPFITALRRIFRKEPYDAEDSESDDFKNHYPLAPDFDVQLWPKEGMRHVIPDVVIYLPKPEDIKSYSPCMSQVSIVGQITPSGFYVGHEIVEIKDFEPNLLTPSLASLCGSILCQEVIRLSNCIKEYFVLDQSVEVVFRLKAKKIREMVSHPNKPIPFETRLKLGGEILDTRLLSIDDKNNDEAVFSSTIPKNSLITRLITDSIEVIEEPLRKTGGIRGPLFFSFLEGEKFDQANMKIEFDHINKIPTELSDLNAFVLGVGGIGTWLCALLAISSIKDLNLTIVDHDSRVEEHNLNRQVLYTNNDIGKSKAKAACDSLKRINNNIKIHSYQFELDQAILKYLNENATEEYQEQERSHSENFEDFVDRLMAMLANDFQRANVILSCPDNLFTRLVINAACWLENKTMINSGIGDGFYGQVDYYDPISEDKCLVQRYGYTKMMERQKQQCGGSVPIPSIVTTNSFVASVQSLFTLMRAAGLPPKINFISYNGSNKRFFAVKLNKDDEEISIANITKLLLEELDVLTPKKEI